MEIQGYAILSIDKAYRKNDLILSSFLCDYKVKNASQDYARNIGITWGKLINRALVQYLKTHAKISLELKDKPLKTKPLLCQRGACRELAVTSGLHKESKKEKRLCACCASLLTKDENIRKYWVVQPY
jgi:hypothetical protein